MVRAAGGLVRPSESAPPPMVLATRNAELVYEQISAYKSPCVGSQVNSFRLK